MERSSVLPWQQTHYPLSWTLSADRARKMSSPGVDGDPKPPCLPRNGLVKLPGQPNGLGTASITKGTPAAKNRPCQPPPPTLPPPSLAAPPPRAALAGGLCPQAGLPLGGPALAPVPGPPVERPPLATDEKILNGLFWYTSQLARGACWPRCARPGGVCSTSPSSGRASRLCCMPRSSTQFCLEVRRSS